MDSSCICEKVVKVTENNYFDIIINGIWALALVIAIALILIIFIVYFKD